MKRNNKATPLKMDAGEIQLLIENWQRAIQGHNETLSVLHQVDNAPEVNRLTERLAYAEDRLKYWLNVQKNKSLRLLIPKMYQQPAVKGNTKLN